MSGIEVRFDAGQGLGKTALHVLQGGVAGRLGAPGWWGRFGAIMGLLGIVTLGGKVGNKYRARGFQLFCSPLCSPLCLRLCRKPSNWDMVAEHGTEPASRFQRGEASAAL